MDGGTSWLGGGKDSEEQTQAEGLGGEPEEVTGLPVMLETGSCPAGLEMGLEVTAQRGQCGARDGREEGSWS